MFIKYPRTPHLPNSPGFTEDDDRLRTLSAFEGKQVIMLEKLDGENSSLYSGGLHARSLDSRNHPSRDWLKRFHATIAHDIPRGWRICGENLYAQHAIKYSDLESYFYLFAIYDENNTCLDWDSTLEWASYFRIPTPKEFYRGIFDLDIISSIPIDINSCEGYVVRNTGAFHYNSFQDNVAKWVRNNHIQTDAHWMHQKVIPNKLKEK